MRAGIPDDLYDVLLWEEGERLGLEEASPEPPDDELMRTDHELYLELMERYRKWREKADKEMQGQE